jgi:hypothetical protein
MLPLPSTNSEIFSNGMYAEDLESYSEDQITLSIKSNSILK